MTCATCLASDAPEARLAVDYFVYRATKEIGALAAVLGESTALYLQRALGKTRRDPTANLRGLRVAWVRTRSQSECQRRTAHLHSTQQSLGLGRSDQRRTHDCTSYRRLYLGWLSPFSQRRSRRALWPSLLRTTWTQEAVSPWHGFTTGLWQKRDQRPRLHPAELRTVRRRRVFPRGCHRTHQNAVEQAE